MKLKVCGMREENNIRELLALSPDFVGLIFYPKSPRYVTEPVDWKNWPEDIKKVGVFVNPTEEAVLEKVKEYQLDFIQLHGGESVDFVKALHEQGLKLIKVFGVMDELPIRKMEPYEAYVDYFLFDTKTPAYGGSGKKFDWLILMDYSLNKPFFLSGGIDIADVAAIQGLKLDKLLAIDINSRFEVEPGLKNIKKVKELKALL